MLAALGVAVGIAVVGDAPSRPEIGWFVIYDRAEERVVFSHPVREGHRVELTHTHSVHRRPVSEVYSIGARIGLAMEEIRFDAHGANLPSGPESLNGVTTSFLREGTGYRVLHHSRPLGTVRMVVGSADVDHIVVIDDERVRLLDQTRPGSVVELRFTDVRTAVAREGS